MYRAVIEELKQWKAKGGRKPLILAGARQVGKTYILKKFGREHFDNVAYVNCDNNPAARELFTADYDLQRILLAITAMTRTAVTPGKTLIILDEIQEAPNGLAVLKYFCENAPEYHVAVAGSLLGVAMQQGQSFPVGKVDVIRMYPMTFNEFLLARGESALKQILDSKDWALIAPFHQRLVQILREYYFVGGMPEAVLKFVESNDVKAVRTVQNSILFTYQRDMSKHVNPLEANRINMVWQSMPAQLVKENKKFLYGVARKGGRAKDFETAIQWLVDAGLVLKCNRVNAPKMPLKFYEDISSFKLFLLDCGLLGALSETSPELMLVAQNGLEEFKGAFTENYVMQQLTATLQRSIFYYSNDAKLEIDFLVQWHDAVVPIEAKAEENVRSKSLRTLVEANPGMKGLRFSMSPYREQEWLTNVPLYAIDSYLQ